MSRIRLRMVDLRRMDRDVARSCFALVCYFGLVFAKLWTAASIVGVTTAWLLWKLMHSKPEFVLSVEPEVKTYPEGCTCIRGALMDNPRCLHHGESERTDEG